MKIADLKFTEQYLYEKPKENYWRGITVSIKGIIICDIEMYMSTEPITVEEQKDPDFWIPMKSPRSVLYINPNRGLIPRTLIGSQSSADIHLLKHKRFLLSEIEDAKEEVRNLVKRYVHFLTVN